MTSAAAYNTEQAKAHGIVPADIGAESWGDLNGVRVWQLRRGLVGDGRFGPASVAAYRAEHATTSTTVPPKLAFVRLISEAAARECPKHGIPPQVCVAQACLESAWGKSAAGFNCFGIRGTGDAGFQLWPTWEIKGGKKIQMAGQKFAKYTSFDAAVAAYCALLTKPRYAGAITHFPRDPARFLTYVWGSGYATALHYVEYVCGVMRSAGKLTGDPAYNVTPDGGLLLVLDRMRAYEGRERIRVRDTEMGTLFRSAPPAEHVPPLDHADPHEDASPMCPWIDDVLEECGLA